MIGENSQFNHQYPVTVERERDGERERERERERKSSSGFASPFRALALS